MSNSIGIILTERGIRQDWLAKQLGVSESYLSLLLQGKRRWTSGLKKETARVLMLPEEILFFDGDCRQSDNNGHQDEDTSRGQGS